MTLEQSLSLISASKDHKILYRVPQFLCPRKTKSQAQSNPQQNGKIFKTAFIDLETTGLEPRKNEIIEIGTLIVSYTKADGFIAIDYQNNQLQQPNIPISEEITKITGITNEDVKDKKIDWTLLKQKLADIDLIICHNAYFDRNFMELQTTQDFSDLIKSKAFACSSAGVDWKLLGYESAKLEYLNFKMGYFYEGHRALIDCFATLNIFTANPKAFLELRQKANEKEYLICATNANFNKKDILKQRGYKWSNGEENLPKSWWTIVPEKDYKEEMSFLKSEVYYKADLKLPTNVITANQRYSYRSQKVEIVD
jgi:DNA polymerase-3 subunit epsilon